MSNAQRTVLFQNNKTLETTYLLRYNLSTKALQRKALLKHEKKETELKKIYLRDQSRGTVTDSLKEQCFLRVNILEVTKVRLIRHTRGEKGS